MKKTKVVMIEVPKFRNIDKKICKTLIPMAIASSTIGTVHAASITEALRPLLVTLQDLAEPIAYAYMIKGFMKIMSGDEHEGYKVIKYAATGFIGIQWIPYIFEIIKGVSIKG